MANWILVVDPDSERRSRFVEAVRSRIAFVDGLEVGARSSENVDVVWAAREEMPVSAVSDGRGVAVIWGEALRQETGDGDTAASDGPRTTLSAESLRASLFARDGSLHWPVLDGFHAAVTCDERGGTRAAADILGLYPVYYHEGQSILLIGSSPALFRYHPTFTPSLDPAGLVGTLLTKGVFDGRTLWKGVRRLAAGHFLARPAGGAAREVEYCEVRRAGTRAEASEASEVSFAEQVDRLEDGIARALERQVDAGLRHGLMLSGGLDSRTLGGFMRRQGVETVAITQGVPSDIEMVCARRVARRLGFEHHGLDGQGSWTMECALLSLEWEQLASGFSLGASWSTLPTVASLAPRIVTGYLLDLVVGYKLPAPVHRNCSFATYFDQRVNNWGIDYRVLARLVRPEVFGDLVGETMGRIEQVYEGYSSDELDRAWTFDLLHRQRFHVGATAWRMSFAGLPVYPVLDWRLLQLVRTLPKETLAQRRAEKALLCGRFADLAALPLDRNSFHTPPLSRPGGGKAALYRLQASWRSLQRRLGYERRYYYRTFDLNRGPWREVRHAAEEHRGVLSDLFRKDVVDEILPPASATATRSIHGSAGIKSLLGLILWLQEHMA